MAQLDKVIEMLNERRQPRFTPSAEPVEAPPKTEMDGLNGLAELLTAGMIKPHEFQGALFAVVLSVRRAQESINEMADYLKTMSEAVERKPESFDPVVASVEGVHTSIQRLIKAINGIKIPEPVVNIPESKMPDPVNLDPVMSGIEELKRIVSTPEADESKGEVAKATEWMFDIKRNRNGFIKSVEAKQA